MTQPAASAHLQALETRLGRRLFDRTSRGLEPLPSAHDLARSIGSSMDVLEACFRQDQSAPNALAGTIHLGGPAEFLGEFLLLSLRDLWQQGIRIRCRLGVATELIDAVQQGDLDFTVATVRVERPGIGWMPIYREEFRLVGGMEWLPLADSPEGRAFDQAPILAYEEGLPILRRYWRNAFGRDPDMTAALVVPDLRALAAAAAAGSGITVLPSYLCSQLIAQGKLVELHRPDRAPANMIHLAWNRFSLRVPRNLFFRDAVARLAAPWLSGLSSDGIRP